MTTAQINRGEFLSTKGAAEVLGVSLRAVQLYCEAGLIPHQKTLGGHRRIRRADLDALVTSLSCAGRAPDREAASPQRGALVDAMLTKPMLMSTINCWRQENHLPPLQHDEDGNPRFASDTTIVQSFHDGLRCALGLLIAFEAAK